MGVRAATPSPRSASTDFLLDWRRLVMSRATTWRKWDFWNNITQHDLG